MPARRWNPTLSVLSARHRAAALAVLGAKLSHAIFELKEILICRLPSGGRRERLHLVFDIFVEPGIDVSFSLGTQAE